MDQATAQVPGFGPVVQRVNGVTRRWPVWPLYVLAVLAVVGIYAAGLLGALGVDPVKAIEHQLGLWALQALVAGLAVTPLRRIFGLNLLRFRRALGLIAFLFVCAHLLTWLVFDMQFLWEQILSDLAKRPYVTLGMAAAVLMVPLAWTSRDRALRRMGARAWRRLHRLTYGVALLSALHFVLLSKGWQIEPLAYGVAILGLLALRLPVLRRV